MAASRRPGVSRGGLGQAVAAVREGMRRLREAFESSLPTPQPLPAPAVVRVSPPHPARRPRW